MKTTDERFFAKVRMTDGCWIWTGSRNGQGYGRFTDQQPKPAHQVAYTRLVGPIPDGLELDHLCRNPSCVRPEHLEPVTHRVNTQRAAAARWGNLGAREDTPDPKGLTTSQAARLAGVSAQTIRDWVAAGKLTPKQTPLGMLFDARAVQKFAETRSA